MSKLKAKRGDSWGFKIDTIKRDRVAVDLTGATAKFTIKNKPTDADPGLVQVTTTSSASGVIVLATGADGSITITDAVTPSLPVGRYRWDLEIIEADGRRSTPDDGLLVVTQDVTGAG